MATTKSANIELTGTEHTIFKLLLLLWNRGRIIGQARPRSFVIVCHNIVCALCILCESNLFAPTRPDSTWPEWRTWIETTTSSVHTIRPSNRPTDRTTFNILALIRSVPITNRNFNGSLSHCRVIRGCSRHGNTINTALAKQASQQNDRIGLTVVWWPWRQSALHSIDHTHVMHPL